MSFAKQNGKKTWFNEQNLGIQQQGVTCYFVDKIYDVFRSFSAGLLECAKAFTVTGNEQKR